jgi:hypothetical protein
MKTGELLKRDIIILSNKLCLHRNQVWEYINTNVPGYNLTLRSMTNGDVKLLQSSALYSSTEHWFSV